MDQTGGAWRGYAWLLPLAAGCPQLPVALVATQTAVYLADAGFEPLEPDVPLPPGFAQDAVTHSMVLLPDTQNYVRPENNSLDDGWGLEILESQVDWIVRNALALKTAAVLHLGDVTQYNSEMEWYVAAKVLAKLEGVVPFLPVAGNHDLGEGGLAQDRQSQLEGSFPPEWLERQAGFVSLEDVWSSQNHAALIGPAHAQWLVTALEFGPRDHVLQWAADVLDGNGDVPALVFTHAHLDEDGVAMRKDHPHHPCNYAMARGANASCTAGQQLWDNWLSQRPTLSMVLSAHVVGATASRRVDVADAGNTVFQMMSNYQSRPHGGEGLLRVLLFLRDRNAVQVRTYSPWLDVFQDDPAESFVVNLASGAFTVDAPRLHP